MGSGSVLDIVVSVEEVTLGIVLYSRNESGTGSRSTSAGTKEHVNVLSQAI